MKIVFFGTSDVGLPSLKLLADLHEVCLVVTNPDAKVGKKQILEESPISKLAKELNLQVVKPERVKGNTELLEQLKELNADIFVVISYGKILPLDLLDIPRLKTINVHFSELPKYRGPSPLQYALLNGDKQTAISIFILDEKVDHGPILSIQPVQIDPNDTFKTLADKCAIIASGQLISTLTDYETGAITQQTQDHSQATKSFIINKEDGKIDWSNTAEQIYNQYRAYTPWPGIHTIWNGQLLKILNCVPISQTPDINSLPLVGRVREGGIIECAQNTHLQIKKLQLPGKNPTDIKSFLNGYKNFVGSRLVQ